MGCSTTFGWGVPDAQSYPARLEARAHEAGFSTVEVVNAGQPGHSSFQGVWLWNGVVHRYKPDLVLIGYVVQDARTVDYTDKSQAVLQGDLRFLKDHVLYRSRVYLALRSVLDDARAEAAGEREQGDAPPSGGPGGGRSGGVFRVPPEDYAENLRELVAGVRRAGGVPVLFGYPLEREGYTAEHRRIMAAAAEVLQVHHFDPQRPMEAYAPGKELYFLHDRGHANASGNDVIASWTLEYLKSQGLLPR
jgi:lysophospholipase L1-like esterase